MVLMAAAVYLLNNIPTKSAKQRKNAENRLEKHILWSTGTSTTDFLHSDTHKNTGNDTQKSIDSGQCELLGEQAKTLKKSNINFKL